MSIRLEKEGLKCQWHCTVQAWSHSQRRESVFVLLDLLVTVSLLALDSEHEFE